VTCEWDTAKDAINRAKHGFPLALAVPLFDGTERVGPDVRFDYGEERLVARGMIEGRLFVCVFTRRGETLRIISLRKANRREQDAYRDGL
jgi:uncharacterized DUF497 family protein